MSLSRLLAFALVLAVLFAPCPGLDCSTKTHDPLPCCPSSARDGRQVGDAPACCQNGPFSSARGMVAAASPSPRHVDGFLILSGSATLGPSPAFAVDVLAYAARSVESPPPPPAVLRL